MAAGFDPGHPSNELLCMWDHLGYLENDGKPIICHESTRVLIPSVLWQKLLARLYLTHMDQTRTLAAAKAKYFWPNMRDQIGSIVRKCSVCIIYAHSMPKEDEIVQSSDSLPSHPMEQVGSDLLHLNEKQTYLFCVDIYSGYSFYRIYQNIPTSR